MITTNLLISQDDFVNLLKEKGTSFSFKDGPEGKDIEIPEIGTIPAFFRMAVVYDQCGEELILNPRGDITYDHGQFSTWLEPVVSEQVYEFILKLMPVFEPGSSENLVMLPVPSWVAMYDSDRDQVCTATGSFIVFRTEAERLWKEYITQNPFDPEVQRRFLD